MTSEKQQSNTDKVVNEESGDKKEVYTPALLTPRYLLPAIVDEDSPNNWPMGKVAAGVAVAIVVAGLVALYIHGSAVVTTL